MGTVEELFHCSVRIEVDQFVPVHTCCGHRTVCRVRIIQPGLHYKLACSVVRIGDCDGTKLLVEVQRMAVTVYRDR